MSYGLRTSVLAEDGSAAQATAVQAPPSTARSWRALDADARLSLIDRMLRPANDVIDAYPLAL